MLRRYTLKIISELKVPNHNPVLNVSQFEALSKQVPLLYFILLVNMTSLALTHAGSAPFWIVVALPIVFAILCVHRAIQWISYRNKVISPEFAYRKLRSTNILAAPIAVFCTWWSISLLPYGDPYQKAHVAFFMAITVIGVIFCLMHLRSAALVVAVTVNIPFMVAMFMTGESTFIATGVNVALVTGAMIAIVVTHYRDFRQLNESRLVLLEQQKALQALSDENLRLANLDSLTEIPNRRNFFNVLTEVFGTAERDAKSICVGVIDLDGFKPINDMYGHAAGDKVLIEVARRLKELEQTDLSFYRLGGDEFGMICTGDCTEARLTRLGEQLCGSIAERMPVGGNTVQVTGSMGVAIYPDVGRDGQDLYERADYALYTAKRYRRAGVVIFNATQAQSLDRQKQVEEALMAGDLDRELTLEYQPIYNIQAPRCIGFEALARWRSPVLGRVSPAEFIPIAEHTGRISLITRTLLRQALEEAKTWPEDVILSFNLSPLDLASPDSILKIIAIVEQSSLDAKRINFEITESAVIRDFEQATQSITLLKRLGAGISLDDFGTGYSSLNHVHKLPLSKIKIDGSFVSEVHERPASAKIIRTMLSLCGELGLGAIVEGVESEAELEVLREMGVQYVQGFHFSRPLTPDDARTLILDEHGRNETAAQQKTA
ncbi:EAL domain-containing protein [Rhizobium lemnae]|uniref:Bifunctional diguanylate cyclase/phosphodiesterase n=1 Tax=Rhizobium lemnae TaxID=1214924 RepID=A0ABV8EGA8_9HYPH|nr:EAL domain-containing protein [Rhizobium lemnae]MCJ8510475.1 EAL domain-containing protein [Rhizobium lemnae]